MENKKNIFIIIWIIIILFIIGFIFLNKQDKIIDKESKIEQVMIEKEVGKSFADRLKQDEISIILNNLEKNDISLFDFEVLNEYATKSNNKEILEKIKKFELLNKIALKWYVFSEIKENKTKWWFIEYETQLEITLKNVYWTILNDEFKTTLIWDEKILEIDKLKWINTFRPVVYSLNEKWETQVNIILNSDNKELLQEFKINTKSLKLNFVVFYNWKKVNFSL